MALPNFWKCIIYINIRIYKCIHRYIIKLYKLILFLKPTDLKKTDIRVITGRKLENFSLWHIVRERKKALKLNIWLLKAILISKIFSLNYTYLFNCLHLLMKRNNTKQTALRGSFSAVHNHQSACTERFLKLYEAGLFK